MDIEKIIKDLMVDLESVLNQPVALENSNKSNSISLMLSYSHFEMINNRIVFNLILSGSELNLKTVADFITLEIDILKKLSVEGENYSLAGNKMLEGFSYFLEENKERQEDYTKVFNLIVEVISE